MAHVQAVLRPPMSLVPRPQTAAVIWERGCPKSDCQLIAGCPLALVLKSGGLGGVRFAKGLAMQNQWEGAWELGEGGNLHWKNLHLQNILPLATWEQACTCVM